MTRLLGDRGGSDVWRFRRPLHEYPAMTLSKESIFFQGTEENATVGGLEPGEAGRIPEGQLRPWHLQERAFQAQQGFFNLECAGVRVAKHHFADSKRRASPPRANSSMITRGDTPVSIRTGPPEFALMVL